MRRLLFFLFLLQSVHGAFSQSDSTACSLCGVPILLTAPSIYASRFAAIIEAKGGVPYAIPSIDTHVNPDSLPIRSLVDSISAYGWVVLPSRTAIDAFFLGLKRWSPSYSISSLALATIGRDADYMLNTYGVRAALVPAQPSPEGIAAELAAMRSRIAGVRIAVVAPRVVGLTEPDVIPSFITRLREIGMCPVKVEAYVTAPASDAAPLMAPLFSSDSGCIIVFTSTAEAEAFLRVMGPNAIRYCDRVACFGPYTAANVRRMGIPVHFVGTRFYSFDAFANDLCRWASSAD